MPNQTRFTNEQKSFIVTSFAQNSIYENIPQVVQHLFTQKFPGRRAPSRATIFRIVKKFEEHSTIENLHKGRSGRPRSVRTPETIRRVEELVAADRDLSPDRVVNTGYRNQLNLSQSSWSRTLREDLNLTCYR